MKIIDKIGINKFMILILSIMGFFVLISSIIITLAYRKNVASITSSYKESSFRAATILNEVIELNNLNSMLLSALNQTDIDKLESELNNIKMKHQVVDGIFIKCGVNCEANKKLYEILKGKNENLINNYILLGKSAEAKEHYFLEVYPNYEKLAIEIKKSSDKLLEYQKTQIKNAEINYKKTLILLVSSYLFLIFLIVLIIFIFKKFILEMFLISLENSKSAATILRGTSEKSDVVSSELLKSVGAQSKIIEINSSSLYQISNLLNQNNELVLQSNQKSEDNKTLILDGIKSLNEVNASIQNISESTIAIQDQIKKHENEFSEITKLILEIGEKTKVINDIVFQTKLLSFNASVEAARAGEHGQGFSVVAEEVGNLAQMSGNAASEINKMLANSVDRVNEILHKSRSEQQKLINIGMASVELGNENIKSCIESFRKIDVKAAEIVEYISNIKDSSQEQKTGVEKILETMKNLKIEADKNTNLASDSNELSMFLSNESEKLQNFSKELEYKLKGRE